MRGRSSRGRIPGSLAAIVSIGLFVALPMSCARQPRINVDQLVCTTSENCPVGRQCFQGRCVVSQGASRDGATDATGNVEPDRAEAGATEAGSTDVAGLIGDSHLLDLPADSSIDLSVVGAGGALGTGGVGAGNAVDVSGGSGTGGMVGSGGIWGAGGSAQIDAAGGTNGSGGAISGGGTIGSGGITSTGGVHSTGGVVGSGGVTGTGGVPGTGGAPSTGGVVGSGGTPSTGGVVGTGGTTSAGGNPSTGGATGSGGTTTVPVTGPCDIYAAANTACVAAHSVVRALYGAYSGKLYQVRRTDNTTQDILTLSAGGIADTGPEDTFCPGLTCVITVVYDQSGNGNDLWYQGSVQVPGSPSSSPANATTDSATVNGRKVYSLYINPGNCYWRDGSATGMPTQAQPEGMYMVTSSRNTNGACCFDYGNSETDRSADGAGAMDAINFSKLSAWGSGAGSGPWVMADLEYGVFAQNNTNKNQNDPTQTSAYVTAVLKNNGTTEFALRGSDATSGSLSTYYKGALPGGWSPMKKKGAITLGCSGDCCKPSGGANSSSGIFYEGAIVTGYPSDATEDAVQANIVAAGYGL